MKNKPKTKWVIIIIVIAMLWLLGSFFAGIVKLFLSTGEVSMGTGNIAVIPIKGFIATSKDSRYFYGESTSSSDVVRFIEKAEKNPEIKAILFDINSGGGTPVATDEIANAIKKSEKFTVSLIRDVGASGAYWIASATDVIIANRMSITGSIGVISSYLEFTGLMDKYGVNYRRLVSGEYKDIGSPFRNMTKQEEKLFQQNLNRLRDIFMDEIAANRNLSRAKVRSFSEGLIYLGEEAKELGMVDVLGNKDDAVKLIEKELNITAKPVEYREKRRLIDVLSELFSTQSYRVGQGIGSSLVRSSATNDLQVYV